MSLSESSSLQQGQSHFARANWPLLVFLTLITFGVYAAVWMHRRRQEFNQLDVPIKISGNLTKVYIVCLLASFATRRFAPSLADSLTLVAFTATTGMAFQMRTILLEHDRLHGNGQETISDFWTLILGAFFIEAKIGTMFQSSGS